MKEIAYELVKIRYQVIDLCKPHFEKAVKLSNEWDNTSFIFVDGNNTVLVMPWNSWKVVKDKDTNKLLCALDGNDLTLYNPTSGEVLVKYENTFPMYKELLGEYIK